jgi:hypothetical protein
MIPNGQEIIKTIDDQFQNGRSFMTGADLKALRKSIPTSNFVIYSGYHYNHRQNIAA